MAEDYAEQISVTVQGFIQVWTRFEAMLSQELSQLRNRLDGIQSEGGTHSAPTMNSFTG